MITFKILAAPLGAMGIFLTAVKQELALCGAVKSLIQVLDNRFVLIKRPVAQAS